MANAAALIQESLWRNNREFRALPRVAQCTYVQLCSTRDLDCAGQITLNVGMLAKACDEVTAEDLAHDLKTLEEARFIFVDEDTDEMLIRSYLRLVSARSPNAYKAALRAALLINSPKLRHELAIELRRIGKADATATADEIDPVHIPSEPHPNPIPTPSEGDIPSEPHSNPPVTVPVRYQSSPSVLGLVGEGRAQAEPRNGQTVNGTDRDEPPPRFCPKHMPDGTTDQCGACGGHRRRRERWDTEHAHDPQNALTAFWDDVRSCAECDDRGWYDDDPSNGRCPNHDWSLINA